MQSIWDAASDRDYYGEQYEDLEEHDGDGDNDTEERDFTVQPESTGGSRAQVPGAETDLQTVFGGGQGGHPRVKTSIRFVPFEVWPFKKPWTRAAPFSAPYGKTMELLDRELQKLGAKGVVVQANLRANQIRQDGWPYADARPRDPGVILNFRTAANVSLSFPCRTYSGFEDNLRAIALSLEALRAVDRYGVTQSAEQYRGWKQIEAPLPGGFHSKEDAAAFIAAQLDGDREAVARVILMRPDYRQERYREVARILHPDRRGGDDELFKRLQQAMLILNS
jgi:hypothetical protein